MKSRLLCEVCHGHGYEQTEAGKAECSACNPKGGSMKVTQWFDGNVNPAHVGFYQRDYGGEYGNDTLTFQPDYWNGSYWRYGASDGKVAMRSIDQAMKWRGLAEKPDGA